MQIVLLGVLFVCFLDVTVGYCYRKVEDGDHCTPKNGVTMLAGSELLIPEKCEKCTCSRQSDSSSVYMSCCGYGIHTGAIGPPPGCEVIAGDDGCSVKIVQALDHSKPCV
ncbi:uncharacterized protein LOC132738045 isoform X1 [Ruditapes philippinarum]|uniref:uncharacterized protein LOC132738045 isoform X1 n=1 Tax=Ruditapes philippinarum TaxID=129788 RepID=UPI00295B200E|nr:uncharacterized protein LOC132738045 isoform X1 [Ruditapes philippinarum]